MEGLRSSAQINKALADEEKATKLIRAQAHIWNHLFNLINSFSLKCATQLGIPDIIHSHGKPMTLSQLISSLPIHHSKTPFVYRLMRILVHNGFFEVQKLDESDGEEGFILTDATRLLLKDNTFSVTPALLAMLDPALTQPWQHLSTWFQNDDRTPFDTAHGMGFWEYAGHNTRFNKQFNDAMESDSRLVTSMVMEKCKGVFEGLESLVDVGGGTGNLAKAIANEFPHMECTVLDLPHVVGDLEGSKNLKYVVGDMFEAVPSADAVLMKCILHDWKDEECVKILGRCKEAITSKGPKKGRVIIIDMVIENHKGDDESTKTQLLHDMLMMNLLAGKERSEKELAKIFSDAGFRSYTVNPILGLRSLIEVYP
ncbi:hypothetical protein FNV43_RR13836 [Rhamnella rubrinervis]|uniref:Uncharacterized protein n=1 Tax=Rhamnella rubrinervis TaxID=2594499 RepID=A0A8K0H1S0_9ROSA|nr:hypothetical protein FNV43_RR13836 [Rhamnella rubrinervis]